MAREDWAGSEEAMDADGQASKGLWCWLDDRFWAVGANGRSGRFRSESLSTSGASEEGVRGQRAFGKGCRLTQVECT